jgi:hypothetical protein
MATARLRSPIGAAIVLVLATVAACRGRVDASTDCSATAIAYCDANGCPLTGPASGAPAALQEWCAAWPSLAARVTGSGTCTTADGGIWATDVRLSDPDGGTLYLLYDPASSQLVSVSTLGGDAGGTGEADYGTCGANSGIVTCTGAAFRCTP